MRYPSFSLGLALALATALPALPPLLPQLPLAFVTEHDAGEIAQTFTESEERLARFVHIYRNSPEPRRRALLTRLRQAARVEEAAPRREATVRLLRILEQCDPVLVRYLQVDDLDEGRYARALRQADVKTHFKERRGFLRRRTHLVLSGGGNDLDVFAEAAGLTIRSQEDLQGLEVEVEYSNSHDPGNMVRERIMEYAYRLRPEIGEGLTWLRLLNAKPALAICKEIAARRFEMRYREGRGSIGKVAWTVRLPHDPGTLAGGQDGNWYACR